MSGAGRRMHHAIESIAHTRIEYRDPAPSLADLRWVLRRINHQLRRCLRALLLTALGAKPAPRRRRKLDHFF